MPAGQRLLGSWLTPLGRKTSRELPQRQDAPKGTFMELFLVLGVFIQSNELPRGGRYLSGSLATSDCGC